MPVLLCLLYSLHALAGESQGFLGAFTGYVGADAKSKRYCGSQAMDGDNAKQASGRSPQANSTKDGSAKGGNEVMLAVGKDMQQYRGCKVSIPGYGDNYVIDDTCPGCNGDPAHMDVSFENSKEGCKGREKWVSGTPDGRKRVQGVKVICPDARGDVSDEIAKRDSYVQNQLKHNMGLAVQNGEMTYEQWRAKSRAK